MVNASEVQALNSRIEKINVQRTKAETRSEMLKKQLEGELSSYESNFGISLKGKDFATTQVKVEAELKKVLTDVETEYKLKEKVVSAIESGDYETAYSLLGIKKEVKPTVSSDAMASATPVDIGDMNLEDIQEPTFTQPDEVEVINVEELMSANKVAKTSTPSVMSMDMEVEDEELSMEESVVSSKTVVSQAPTGSKSVAKTIKGTSAVSAMEEMQVEDDPLPNLDDTDFGLGNLLQGSRFDL